MLVERLNRLSLKNKIFFSTLAVILPLSVGIALLARGLLISSLVCNLGFIAAMVLVSFGISHWLVRHITRPLRKLIRMTNEISQGNLDVTPGLGTEARCWELKNCKETNCAAYRNTELPCWYVNDTACSEISECNRFPEKLERCYGCAVYKNHMGDEVNQLADSFNHMTRRLKASQEKLRESEEKYRSLSESGPNPVFVVDKETLEILDANPSAEQTYGYTREELLGRPFTDLGIFKYGEADLGAPPTTGTLKECLVADKVLHFKRGNRPFYVNARACPTRYEDREAFILATTDITELIDKNTRLIQASKMTGSGEMSADIAHELNQPLNAIKVGNEFLKMMIEEGKEIQERDLSHVVTEVSRQVDRAAEIIKRLRNFGRKVE